MQLSDVEYTPIVSEAGDTFELIKVFSLQLVKAVKKINNKTARFLKEYCKVYNLGAKLVKEILRLC